MAIYTLKSNILVYFFAPQLLTCFIPFQIAILPLLRNCAKFLPFIHQSSPFKFTVILSVSERHQNCCLKRD